MFVNSTVRSFCSATRISLALLLSVMMASPDLALAQEPATPCNMSGWTASSANLAPPSAPSYYGVETFASAVATANSVNYLYAIGGMDCNTSATTYNCSSATFQNQVGHATLNSDGSLGSFSWQNLWSFAGETQPVGLGRDLCGAIYNSPSTNKNYLYTVGGLAYDPGTGTSALTNQIWYAQISPTNGSLLAWHQATKSNGTPFVLPSALDLHGVVVLNGYLYVIGGTTDGTPGGLTDQVWSAQLNQNSGNLMGTAFTAQPPIEKSTSGIYKTCPVSFPTSSTTGVIYVAGGETHNGPSNPPGTDEVWYATQQTGGILTAWASASPLLNNPLQTYPLASQAVVYNSDLNGIILMGGDTTGQSPDTGLVELGSLTSQSSVIDWSASTLPSLGLALNNGNGGVIERNAGATNGKFIYSLGGEVTSNQKQSDSKAIYCLQVQN